MHGVLRRTAAKQALEQANSAHYARVVPLGRLERWRHWALAKPLAGAATQGRLGRLAHADLVGARPGVAVAASALRLGRLEQL